MDRRVGLYGVVLVKVVVGWGGWVGQMGESARLGGLDRILDLRH